MIATPQHTLDAVPTTALRTDDDPTSAIARAAGVAVHCQRVCKAFGDGDTRVRVLHDVEVEVRAGEMSLLVGPSGCGKTTLISIIAGLLEPTAGDVTLFGTARSKLSARQLIAYRAKNIGFVFQQYNLLPALTATANVAIPLLIARMNRERAFEQARRLLAQVGMADRADALPTQLSGGQQQRVAIARALVHEPRLLVCDEPTAALDAQSGQTVMELLRRVAVQADRAVIVVTHDNRVFRFGDRIIEMDDGRIQAVRMGEAGSGAPAELASTEQAIKVAPDETIGAGPFDFQ
ncbi:MAG TPA: ABC transporter ATP-binding protein [Pirellulales bacterium]|jgi:putative ABC transport system ATP-binding protein